MCHQAPHLSCSSAQLAITNFFFPFSLWKTASAVESGRGNFDTWKKKKGRGKEQENERRKKKEKEREKEEREKFGEDGKDILGQRRTMDQS